MFSTLQGSSSKKVSVTPSAHRKLSPSEVMHNRFMELQKRAAEAAQAVQVCNVRTTNKSSIFVQFLPYLEV